MTTYKYEDGDKELFANEMDEVENVSYRDTMIKFHASSIAPVLKAYLDRDKKCRLPYNDDIVYRAASIIAEKTYENFTKCSFDSCFESLFKKELSKKEQIRLLKGGNLQNLNYHLCLTSQKNADIDSAIINGKAILKV